MIKKLKKSAILFLVIVSSSSINQAQELNTHSVTLESDNQQLEISQEAAFQSPLIARILTCEGSAESYEGKIKFKFIPFKILKLLAQILEIQARSQDFSHTSKLIDEAIDKANLTDNELSLFYDKGIDFLELKILTKYFITKLHQKYSGDKKAIEIALKAMCLPDGVKIDIAKEYFYLFSDISSKQARKNHFLDIDIDYDFSIQELLNADKIPKTMLDPLFGPTVHKMLNLSHFRIGNLDGLSNIPEASEIQTLHLDNNHITTLPNHIFEKFQNLKMLSLDNNNLIELDGQSFKGLDKLYALYIRAIGPVKVPANFLHYLPGFKQPHRTIWGSIDLDLQELDGEAQRKFYLTDPAILALKIAEEKKRQDVYDASRKKAEREAQTEHDNKMAAEAAYEASKRT